MSWIEKLYETYERCDGALQFSTYPMIPICHVRQQAHIEIAIDGRGKFLRARVLQREEQATTIPATEGSASRTSNAAPHPLCDKIQYCAVDYAKRGGKKKPYHQSFMAQLRAWCASPFAHPKAEAVLAYLANRTLLFDLWHANTIVADNNGMLLDVWGSDSPLPPLFKLLTAKQGNRDQGDALLRWRVEMPGDPVSAVWEDSGLQNSWIDFCARLDAERGLCLVTGKDNVLLASKHPRGIRWPGDSAKMISSNDVAGFSFRGRFHTANEAAGVSFEVTQKAHNALRWLIDRQNKYSKTAEQVFVSWSVGGQRIPDPLKNTAQLFFDAPQDTLPDLHCQDDASQDFHSRLRRLIAAHSAGLDRTDTVVMMGLDSVTPGRMAITFYRELTGSEFLQRLLTWHESHAWQQTFSKHLHFIGAPGPRDITEAAYGRKLDEKLRKATLERLLPCIIDGYPIPRDIVEFAVRRAWNRTGLEQWEWTKYLGVACSLYKGRHKEENYQMSLEVDRTSRDYLFGRLLAIADHLEQRALYMSGERRDSNAARLMQRFAEHPCSTWRDIELALSPYKTRLRSGHPSTLAKLDHLLDEITGKFSGNEFTNDDKLSGEFLLGFHCQRSALWHTLESNNGGAAAKTNGQPKSRRNACFAE